MKKSREMGHDCDGILQSWRWATILLFVVIAGCIERAPTVYELGSLRSPVTMTNAASGAILQSKPVEPRGAIYHLWLRLGGHECQVPATESEDWGQFVTASGTNKAFVLVRRLIGEEPVAWDLDRIVELTIPSSCSDTGSVGMRVVLTNDVPCEGGRSWVHEVLRASADGKFLTVKRAYPIPQGAGTRYEYRTVRLQVATGIFMGESD